MSETYRALTRKYRPSSFSDIVSQEHVSSTLENAIKQNKLSHAYLFSGPRGVGKTTMARVLARTINDLDQQVDGEQLNKTLNVVEIDAASNNKVEDVHSLRESVRIPPQNGRYKVFIIDEVHMLSTSAFNALLKTLEEPPEHAIFIFATTEPHKVLPTILSRVQRFDFKRISVDEMVERLTFIANKENIEIDEESLHVIAKKADGALRDALGLMDQAIAFCGTTISHEELLRALNVVSTDRMFAVMEHVVQQDADGALVLIDQLMQDGYDIQEFLVGLTEHLRNIYMACSTRNTDLIEATEETKTRYKKVATAFSRDDIMRMLHIISEAQYKIREAHQPRIQFEITLLKLIHMSKTEKLSELINELKSLKKKLLNSSPTEQTATSETQSHYQDQASARNGKKQAEKQKTAPDTGQNTDDETDSQKTENNGSKSVTESEPESETDVDVQQAAKEGEEENVQNILEDKHDFFGPPSLSSADNKEHSQNEIATQTTKKTSANKQSAQRETDEAKKEIKQPPKYLHDVKELWPEYLTNLKTKIPKMLYLQLQRVSIIEFENNILTIACSDPFTERMIEENETLLARMLKQLCGTYISIKAIVRKPKKDTTETKSPYERFKELQGQDPKIRTIVELFGAELDY